MQAKDLLNQIGGVSSVARELGVSEQQASEGAAALLPAILGGFKKQAQTQPNGVEGLTSMLGRFGGEGLLDDVLGSQPTNVNRGNDVLGQIFGSKDVSRTVARNASNQSGLDPGLLKRMLPMLAMMIAGYMASGRGSASPGSSPASGGGLGGMLGGLLGGSAAGGQSGLGGLASMLDMDRDGNPLDDILGMLGKG